MRDYGSEYYLGVEIAGAVIAALAIIHAIIWVWFEHKQKEERNDNRRR